MIEHRRNIVGLFAAIILLGILGFLYRGFITRIENGYMTEWVGALLVDHMAECDGQMPNDWMGLKEVFDKRVLIDGEPWSFQKLQSRINIRWNIVQSELLDQQLVKDLVFVWPKEENPIEWIEHKGNRTIREYVRRSIGKGQEAEETGAEETNRN